MFIHRLFYLGIAGQRTASAHAESLGRLGFGRAIITNTLINDQSGRFLGEHLARPVIAV
jgi:hypothetical protein